jgi:hypothetical protein
MEVHPRTESDPEGVRSYSPRSRAKRAHPGITLKSELSLPPAFRGEQGFDLRLVPEKLIERINWYKPKLVFVNSMNRIDDARCSQQHMLIWMTTRSHV